MEILFLWALCVIVGFLIGRGKGRGLAGAVWSFFLGIFGWIVAAALPPSESVAIAREIRKQKAVREALGKDNE